MITAVKYKGVEVPYYFINDETGEIFRETQFSYSKCNIKINKDGHQVIWASGANPNRRFSMSLKVIILETYFGYTSTRGVHIKKKDESLGWSRDNVEIYYKPSKNRRFSTKQVRELLYEYYVENTPVPTLEDIYDIDRGILVHILCGSTYSEIFKEYKDKLAEIIKEDKRCQKNLEKK